MTLPLAEAVPTVLPTAELAAILRVSETQVRRLDQHRRTA